MQQFMRIFLISLGLCLSPALVWAEESYSFHKLSGTNFDKKTPVKLEAFHSAKTILVFWRSDCGLCLEELPALIEIAYKRPDTQIVLLSLLGEEQVRGHVPENYPENFYVVAVSGDDRELMKAFGNHKNNRYMIPYSVRLYPDGTICRDRLGLLGITTVDEWDKSC